ncbi:hypothetical protein HPB52_003691 [Rhipicephalus sanguineus]|uniref:Retrotransposon gag domain-containing protein n=1 Tax=Rhipicephalus sanguineus TaxID=34632 RepID=A0A9D4SMV9_RHISA|nr:hypothetical protein HPB52_003691 [Rhipicephalus sanguineus]
MAAHFANLPPFLNVPGKPSIPWHLWKKIFQVHLKAAGGSGWEDERRASALITVLGIEGQRKYFAAQEQLEAQGGPNATHTASTPTAADSGTVSTDAATTEYDTLLQFLDGLFAESTNVLAERHLFTSRKQLPGETFLDFVTALKEKALSCKFGATYDDRVRDQAIHGVANAHVRAKLLSYGEALTLQKAEEVGRDLEALNEANAAFGENERLLGLHSVYGGSIQCVAAAQNGGSAASLVPHVTQHGGGFPPGAGGRVQDGSAGSTALAQCCVRCQQDDDGRGRRPHSRLRISNQVFPAQAIRGSPAVQCDSTSAEAQLQLPATQYHPLGLQEESPGYSSSPAVNAPNSNTGEGSNATGSSESAHGSRNPPSSWRDWDRSSKSAPDSRHTQSSWRAWVTSPTADA